MRRIASNVLAIFALSIGLTTLISYMVNKGHLSSWVKDGTPMAVSTAVAIIALAMAIIVRRWKLKAPEPETDIRDEP